jgi:DNA-binding GntR family transcriptional regulator
MTSASEAVNDDLTLAERAYLVLRDRLVTLVIRPGSPLNEEALAADMGLGRTPVREALKRLETERLVVVYPRRGTFATDVHITDLRHIFEVRQQLEPAAAANAASRATDKDRIRLTALLGHLETGSSDARSLITLDMQVHRAIYAATHNPFLEDTLTRYDNLATRIWCLFVDQLPGLAGNVEEHIPLLHAVIGGDSERARVLAAEHVAHFESAIREFT